MTMGSRRSSDGDTSVDDLHSRCSVSLEFDDYPLDLVSPIARDYGDPDQPSPSRWGLSDGYDFSDQRDPFLAKSIQEPFLSGNTSGQTDPFLSEDITDQVDPFLSDDTFKFIDERDRFITDEIITDYGQRRSCEYNVPDRVLGQTNGDIFVTANNLHKLSSVYPVECDEYPVGTEEEELHYERRGYCSAIGEWFRMSCKSCLAKNNTLPDAPSWRDRWRYALLCPPHGWLSHFAALMLLVLVVWGLLWTVSRSGAQAGGGLLALVILTVTSYIAGSILTWIRLPALMGMFAVGCLLRNAPNINVAANIDPHLAHIIRELGLAMLLLRSGLVLTPLSLRHQSFTILRLAVLPSVVEAITTGIVSKYLLHIPWLWAFLVGVMLSAAGPVVINPCVLSLQSRGYGLDKAIPSMLVAASSVDNVIPVTGFSVILVMICNQAQLVLNIFRGPLEAMGAVLGAMIIGMILWYIPHTQHPNHKLLRVILLLSCGVLFTMGSWSLGLLRAIPVGCITLVFITVTRWRKSQLEEKAKRTAVIEDVFKRLWYIVQPLFYGILGTEVDLSSVDTSLLGSGILIILISITVRLLSTFLSVFRTSLSMKERIFVAFAWLPKAYIQLTLGVVVVQTLTDKSAIDEADDLINLSATMSLLAVLITLPLGGVLTMLSGPCLLSRDEHVVSDEAERVDLAWGVQTLKADVSRMKVSDISTHTGTTEIEITTERETVT